MSNQKSLSETMKKYSDIVASKSLTEARRMSEEALQYAFYLINEDVNTLHIMYRDGWIDPQSEILVSQASKLLRKAVRISNTK